MFRRLHNYFAGRARERGSFQESGRGSEHERGGMLRKFADDFPGSVIRRSAGTRAPFAGIDKTTARGIAYAEKCVRYVKMERGGSQTRATIPAATVGWILMTWLALVRDNRNGFIRFTYTPRDLSVFRASRLGISPHIEEIGNIYHARLIIILIAGIYAGH